MSSVRFRRAAVLGTALALVVAGGVTADTLTPDGDAVDPGSQTQLAFDVAPGGTVALDVSFVLACKNSSHFPAGATLDLVVSSKSTPDGGTATWDPGRLDVPTDWPASGSCPDPAPSPVDSTTPVHLVLTAPSTPGPWDAFDFFFAVDPYAYFSNSAALTVTLNDNGGGGEPDDTTPPELSNVPGDMTVFTSGTSATVSWADPTATDDTDPSPSVACDPASGSSFALGTTTVTCTATDASGNAAQATFAVTVRQLTGTWGRPLDSGKVPALVGQLGRTIPLKLDVTSGDTVQGPGAIDAPGLLLDLQATCSAGAPVLDSRAGGTFEWSNGAWQLNLRTDDLSTGCWRLTATLDGAPLASATVLLTTDATAQGNVRTNGLRPTR